MARIIGISPIRNDNQQQRIRQRTMNSIKASWEKIAHWYGANSPQGTLTLANGASEEEISSLERLIGMSLPVDVKESYRMHNGNSYLQGLFPYGLTLMSIDRIAQAWLLLVDRVAKGEVVYDENVFPKGPIRKTWWCQKWIPITEARADYSCIDMAPAEGGIVGQVICFFHETGPSYVEASSWQAYLSDFADALERGKFRYDDRMGLRPIQENEKAEQ